MNNLNMDTWKSFDTETKKFRIRETKNLSTDTILERLHDLSLKKNKKIKLN